MLKKLFRENPDIYILLLNVTAILCILIPEYISTESKVSIFSTFLLIAFLGCLAYWKKNNIFNFFRSLQVSIFIFVLFILFAQLLYVAFPTLYPGYISNLLESKSGKEMKIGVTEYLDQSPFVKPKANVPIHLFIAREPGFENDWITDNRGYKNNLILAQKNQFDVIALGDSYTEGFGVKTDSTWVSRLNSLGITAYSLGVQNSAPSQFNGTFKLFGSKLNPKLVIIGYLAIGVYQRETKFLKSDEEIKKNYHLPSAIIGDGKGRIAQYKSVIFAIYFFIKKYIYGTMENYKLSADPQNSEDERNVSEKLMVADKDISFGKMQIYKKEIQQNVQNRLSAKDELGSSLEWKRTINAFKEIAIESKKKGAKVMMLIFHGRDEMYFTKATGKKISENYEGFIETELLKEFAMENELFFLNTDTTFLEYVKKLDEKTNMSEYPYFKYDPHLSNKGNELVANLVANYIKSNHLLSN